MHRHLISAAIVLFWLAMMTSLVRDRILPERRQAAASLMDPEALAINWYPVREWNWIRQNERIIGGAALTVDQNDIAADQTPGANGYTVLQNALLSLPLLGMEGRQVALQMRLALNPAFTVDRFAIRLETGGLAMRGVGFIDHEALYYRLDLPDAPAQYGYFPMRHPPSLLSTVQPLLSRHFRLEVGDRHSVDVLDPVWDMTQGRAEVLVAAEERILHEGEERKVYRLETRFGGIVRSSWVSEDNRVLRRELFQGLTMEASSKKDLVRRFPALNDTIQIPEIDREQLKNRARQAGTPQLPPGVLGSVGQFLEP